MTIDTILNNQEEFVKERAMQAQIYLEKELKSEIFSQSIKEIDPCPGNREGSWRGKYNTKPYLENNLHGIISRITSGMYSKWETNSEWHTYMVKEPKAILDPIKKEVQAYSKELIKLDATEESVAELASKIEIFRRWAYTAATNDIKDTRKTESKIVPIRTSNVGSGKEVKPVNKQAAVQIKYASNK